MERIRIAVISDLHIGSAARSPDLCPDGLAKPKVEDSFAARFADFVRADETLGADFLVVPGDVTDTAQPVEVELASQLIASWAADLGVASNSIIPVPGNHDVDWEVLKIPDATGVRFRQRYDPLRMSGSVFTPNPDVHGSLLEDPYFSIAQYPRLLAVSYNSAWSDEPDTAIHHGALDPSHLESLGAALNLIPKVETELRLFVVHHHPIPYSEPSNFPDFSLMTNAESLLSLLRAHDFDLLIHGHRHHPRFRVHAIDSGFPLAVLAAGSFSVDLPPEWKGVVTNQFHLIDVTGRDDQDGFIRGHVKSWAYNHVRGWEPSDTVRDGMSHVHPFGTYLSPLRLRSAVMPVIASALDERGWVNWEEVIRQLGPAYAHVPEPRARELFQAAERPGVKLVGGRLDEWTLVQEGSI